jgi:hypothetical protein
MFCVPVAAPLITIVTEDIAVADAKSTTSLGVRPSRLRARGASVERPVRNDAASTIRSTLPTATADNVTTAREEERPIDSVRFDTNSQLIRTLRCVAGRVSSSTVDALKRDVRHVP